MKGSRPDEGEGSALNRIDKKQTELIEMGRPMKSPIRDEEIQKDSQPHAKPSMAELRAYFAQQAAALGVDLSDPDDRIAQVVRIGLADLDPTRVMKNCQHIHVMTTSYGMPAEMLGLPTAGSKRVICLKHGHSIETLSLDAAYESFTKAWPWEKDAIRCENCPDTAPHPKEWEWTEEWSAAQHVKYLELKKCHESNADDPPEA